MNVSGCGWQSIAIKENRKVDKNMWLVYSVLAGLVLGHVCAVRAAGNRWPAAQLAGVVSLRRRRLFPDRGAFSHRHVHVGRKDARVECLRHHLRDPGRRGRGAWEPCASSTPTAAPVSRARENPGLDIDYRLYIGPIIFAMAPLLNTLVSLLWHPSPDRGCHGLRFEHMPSGSSFSASC